MVWSIDSIPSQEGRTVLVTGANSGLGLETSKILVNKGATVILGCRTLAKAERTRKILRNETDCGNIDLVELNLADLFQVEKATDQIKLNHQKLDLLINNAGVMAPPQTVNKQGFELQFVVNHLSHMALTLNLLPLLANTSASRVVTVSSGAQYMGKILWEDMQGKNYYDRWAFYSQSKLANVMFALELSEKLKRSNLDILSLSAHPGLARTNLQQTSVIANGSWQEGLAYKLMDPFFQSSFMGSLPQLFAATSSSVKSGEQYGPRFNFRGYPRRCRIAPLALSQKNREQLWQMSEKLIEDFIGITKGKELLSE